MCEQLVLQEQQLPFSEQIALSSQKAPFLSAQKAEGQGTTISINRYKRQHKLLLPLLLAGNCEQEPVALGVDQGTSHSTRETTGRGDKCMFQSLLSSARTWCPSSWGWPAGPQGVPPPQAGTPHWVQQAALGGDAPRALPCIAMCLQPLGASSQPTPHSTQRGAGPVPQCQRLLLRGEPG